MHKGAEPQVNTTGVNTTGMAQNTAGVEPTGMAQNTSHPTASPTSNRSIDLQPLDQPPERQAFASLQSSNPADPYTYSCGGFAGNMVWIYAIGGSETGGYASQYAANAQVTALSLFLGLGYSNNAKATVSTRDGRGMRKEVSYWDKHEICAIVTFVPQSVPALTQPPHSYAARQQKGIFCQ